MKKLGKALTLLATLVLLTLPFVVWYKAQALVDWWALKDYTPPARIAELADDSSMTKEAEHIFYVNHPELISDVNRFHRECPQSEQTIVLGCYHSKQNGIDIYDVQDPRLSGIHEVTAAHEMLHAAYDRLSGDTKRDLNSLLHKYFSEQLKDERILDTLRTYEGLEPAELVNEMHSIFGTEAKDLPAELEAHYKRYFINRSEVVSLAENYAGEFTSRTNAIEDYDRRLSALKQEIEDTSSSLEAQRSRVVEERRRLDSLRTTGRTDEYNAGVSSFNAQVDAYNASVAILRRDINTYNTLVAERNALARELQSLDEAIDTRLIPEPVR